MLSLNIRLGLLHYIRRFFPFPYKSIRVSKEGVYITVSKEFLRHVLFFFKNSSVFSAKLLLDIVGTDFPSRPNRFEVTYVLLSLKWNLRFYIRVYTDEVSLLPSVSGLFSSSIWLEREVWDMLGVCFSGNKDLRRILTDYGFEGFPLRKDFPLSGFSEVRYDDSEKRIVLEPLEISQEFRNFSFNSPWIS